MKLSDKREIVRRFRADQGVCDLDVWLCNSKKFIGSVFDAHSAVEQVLRDYLNKKFSLRSKGSGSGRNRKVKN